MSNEEVKLMLNLVTWGFRWLRAIRRFLGSFIGSPSEREEYVVSKVCRWVGHFNVIHQEANPVGD